ncbi:MAG: hypothetical protein HYV96_12835 [Opitutae bacterium]|nr:hypothetical protein [Opitutae bacterium]
MLFAVVFGAAASDVDIQQSVQAFIRREGVRKIVSAAEQVTRSIADGGKIVWVAPLDQLRPRRAYCDRVNLVIVIREDTDGEHGLYVVLPHSSHLPVAGDGWTFEPKDSQACFYTRKK